MLRALLIDDQASCLSQLSTLLAMCCADTVQVVGQSQTVEAALLAIEALQPDLLFLDVELDGNKNGFSLLGAVSQVTFDVIFVTAHENHAHRAFQVDAIDYLLKPIDIALLTKAVLKAENRSQIDRKVHKNQLEQVKGRPVNVPEKIRIADKEIYLSTIVYFESDGSYTNLYEKGETTKKTLTYHLGKLEESLLGDPVFFRIHDKYLINITHFKSYRENRRCGIALMKDGTSLQVSNRRKAAFKKRLQELYPTKRQS